MAFGLCVLGCGGFANAFARAMEPLRGEIDLFFASRDGARAAAFNERHRGAGAFGSYEAAVSDPRVDAVYVCTPHHRHRAHVELAAAAGKHALVEKPIARTLDEARAIIGAAASAGIVLMVAENYRFLSGVRLSRRLLDGGAIGELRLFQMQEEAPFDTGGWRGDPSRNGGGVLIDGGIHKVDVLVNLAGRPRTVFASVVPPGNPGLRAEDGLVMATASSNGVVGLVNHTWTRAARPSPIWMSAQGTGGAIYYEAGASWLRLDDGRSERIFDLEPDGFGLTPMAREFKASVKEGREPEMSGSAGMLDLAVVLKAYESMETGTVAYLDGPAARP